MILKSKTGKHCGLFFAAILVVYVMFSMIDYFALHVLGHPSQILTIGCALSLIFIFGWLCRNFLDSNTALVLIACLLLHLLFYVLDIAEASPIPPIDSDTATYIESARDVYLGTHEGWYINYYSTWVGKFVYTFWGESVKFVRFLNVVFFSIGHFFFALTLQVLGLKNRQLVLSLFLVGIMPNMLFYCSEFNIESMFQMMMAIAFYFFVCWINDHRDKNLVFSLLFTGLGVLLHNGALALMSVEIIYFVCNKTKVGNRSIITPKNLRNFGVMMLFVVIAVVVFPGTVLYKFGGSIPDVTEIFRRLDLREVGNTTYHMPIGTAAGNTIADFLIGCFLRPIYFWLSPMIWDIHSNGALMIFASDSLWYLTLCMLFLHYYKFIKKEDKALAIALVLIVVLSGLIFGWGVSNAGTAMRHRNKFIFINGVALALINKCRSQIKIKRNFHASTVPALQPGRS